MKEHVDDTYRSCHDAPRVKWWARCCRAYILNLGCWVEFQKHLVRADAGSVSGRARISREVLTAACSTLCGSSVGSSEPLVTHHHSDRHGTSVDLGSGIGLWVWLFIIIMMREQGGVVRGFAAGRTLGTVPVRRMRMRSLYTGTIPVPWTLV